MWFTGIIFEILFSFYTLNAFLVEKPHRHSVYAVFPYPNKFYGRNKIPAVLLISGYCYHDFQDSTAVKYSLLSYRQRKSIRRTVGSRKIFITLSQ